MPDKPPTPGVIVTKMVKAPAGKLVVNAELADLSSLTVEILDAHGNAVPGFEAKHCRLRRYDDLRYEVRFESSDGTSRTVKDLQQRDSGFRLRIKVFEDAALFAFQIKPL